MVVITISKCPASLRGDLSKWFFEVSQGVYVGTVSQRVRENVWDRIEKSVKSGRAVLVYSCHDEQKLKFLVCGESNCKPIDYDGIEIMKHLKRIESSETKDTSNLLSSAGLFPDGKFVALDIETTGLDSSKDLITEIAAVKFEESGEVVDRFKRYICIDISVPDNIQKLTGITDELLKNEGVQLETALNDLQMFVEELPIVCHNAEFDMAFLKNKVSQESEILKTNQVVDTLNLSRKLIKDVQNYKLPTLAKYFSIAHADSHEALVDAEVTGQLVAKLKILEINK
ncbi:type I-E CRISPR-associated endoribonuclease Cas2e [Ileibacterium valens]|uniref:Type I-E CRISPR-associated endoribonuclease Cas2 n=1 Tax=Ileibacterium valens TaxID=1862668 RepID=A0A1U7NE65_9FIRM|nr:type I-E CRISPR-associated endoribonuclease Cas2e [Ileibacterium valens]OLU36592.1 type I-E CRISPR-associated endoribonuclease Cas2 [Erysipelotrichaceae bacterium NYU-BL-E8]OLU37797.1 type I-E CRISPR-associated endoribonuclease Cas2 [Ileibacterium valens]OLU41844.1 type I-E CRISPR-associated endoribonuclease Cas2 [Erysipelotrichaceae bacterium NYU-BL-F16]